MKRLEWQELGKALLQLEEGLEIPLYYYEGEWKVGLQAKEQMAAGLLERVIKAVPFQIAYGMRDREPEPGEPGFREEVQRRHSALLDTAAKVVAAHDEWVAAKEADQQWLAKGPRKWVWDPEKRRWESV